MDLFRPFPSRASSAAPAEEPPRSFSGRALSTKSFGFLLIRAFWFVAILCPMVTFAICYWMWVDQDCRAFLPFLSDFGLQGAMRDVFTVGLAATSCLVLCVSTLHFCVFRRVLCLLRVGQCISALSVYIFSMECVAALSIGALPLYPWDENLEVHFIFAGGIMFGGLPLIIGNFVLLYQLGKLYPLKSSTLWRILRNAQGLIMLVNVLSAISMIPSASVALRHEEYGIVQDSYVYSQDWGEFCSTLYDDAETLLALLEWMYVLSLMVSFAVSLPEYEILYGLIGTLEAEVKETGETKHQRCEPDDGEDLCAS